MTLKEQQIKDIEEILRKSLRNKFQKYNPEPSIMPFILAYLVKIEWLCFLLFIP